MTALSALWLPILLSAVFVFIVSSIIHMGPFWHRSDYPMVPNEEKLMEALRPVAPPPGDYMVPKPANMKEMSSPAFIEKMNEGPVLMMTVMPNGPMSMGSNLLQWFIYSVFISLFAGYVASRALGPGASYLEVFRFAGATAFAAYALALWQLSIWYRRAWSITLTWTLDGLIYACVTAGTFGWLWPH